jgi:hypothetical protein
MMVIRNNDREFLNFLHNELELTRAAIGVALRHREFDDGPLPMLLWQYGLVDLQQLERILDWLDEQL